jgi:hypothetical protein
MADVQIAVIDTTENQVNVAVPGVQGPIGLTGSVAIAQDGTATEPGIRFESDTNTGIYRPGADQLAISTNGVSRLQVAGNICVVGAADAVIAGLEVGQGATGNRITYLDFIGDTTYTDHGLRLIRAGDGSNSDSSLINRGTGNLRLVSQEAGAIAFLTTNAERARIDSSGRLLVGTSSAFTAPVIGTTAATPFVQAVGNTISSASLLLADFNSTDAHSSELFINKSGSSTVGANVVLASNERIGRISFAGADGTNYIPSSAITAEVDGTPGANDMPGRLVFSTTADGAATPTERMRIDSAGTTTITSAAATAPFIAKVSTSEVARIDSSGRLLVGASSADTTHFANVGKVFIEGITDAGSALIQTCWSASDTSQAFHILAKSGGASVGTRSIVAADEQLGQIAFEGDDGTNFIRAASIRAVVDGTPGTNDMPGRLIFSTTADGAASPTERLRITSAGVLQVADAGNIQVGTTTGTKIGTGTTQKIGFYDATPVVQPTAVADATDAATVITQLNALLTRMRNLGLIAT